MSAALPNVLVVAGARPNFIKVAPIMAELERRAMPSYLLHTGQHYSAEMSQLIFRDLGMREPDRNLAAGSGSHARQTAGVMQAFEPVLLEVRPRWVVVVGDVNSTLACALVAAKLREEVACGIAHVEAGLRSFDWRMPEEVNRVLTDRLSDLLLTPSREAHANLAREGIEDARVVFAGNVMIDTLYRQLDAARALGVARKAGVDQPYVAVTLHRPSNVDSAETLRPILEGLTEVARHTRIVFPMHPRTRERVEALGLESAIAPFTVLPPLGYLEMLSLTDGASAVLTDSGGLQEETTVLGVPCVTLREQTERPSTVSEGTNRLTRWPPTPEGIMESYRSAMAAGRQPLGARAPEGWDGATARRIVDALVERA